MAWELESKHFGQQQKLDSWLFTGFYWSEILKLKNIQKDIK